MVRSRAQAPTAQPKQSGSPGHRALKENTGRSRAQALTPPGWGRGGSGSCQICSKCSHPETAKGLHCLEIRK